MALFKIHISLKLLQTLVAVWVFLLFPFTGNAQFAPPAGQEGTTAISANSNVFVAWASNGVVERGPMDISEPELGEASFGTDSLAKGKSDGAVVSLGDGGNAILTFKIPIVNGEGADFAVFENSFLDDFLELAFVEVSSNGFHFIRFESTSNTQTEEQVGTFGSLDATQINNLAGKYRGGFGTPFDLEELKDAPELDVNNIKAIRIVDVVGNILEEYATYDINGNPINDPWPTPFETSGFDLDAVGVIHDKEHTLVIENNKSSMNIYPNPFSTQFIIGSFSENGELRIFSTDSQLIFSSKTKAQQITTIDGSNFPKGLLLVKFTGEKYTRTTKIIHH